MNNNEELEIVEKSYPEEEYDSEDEIELEEEKPEVVDHPYLMSMPKKRYLRPLWERLLSGQTC